MNRDEVQSVRQQTFVDSCRAVCEACGRRAFPFDKEYHEVHGPNTAGNYTHRRTLSNGDVQETLCKASSIWAMSRFEDARYRERPSGDYAPTLTEDPLADSPQRFRSDPEKWQAWFAGARWLAETASDIEGYSEYQIGDRALAKLNLLPAKHVRRRNPLSLEREREHLKRILAEK